LQNVYSGFCFKRPDGSPAIKKIQDRFVL